MRKEKAPIYKSSRSEAPKLQQVCHYRHVRKTSCLILLHDKRFIGNYMAVLYGGFSSSNNFASLGSIAKHIIILFQGQFTSFVDYNIIFRLSADYFMLRVV